MASVFIDGQAGTTGLQITQRLEHHHDVDLVYLDDQARKDPEQRQRCLQQADIAILCLPDEAAIEAVELAAGKTRILDASTAHRTNAAWAYGLPELNETQRQTIADAQFVSNPGCYPQGFILLARALIEAGMLDPQLALRCYAVSGYSGGGRQMIETFQAYDSKQADCLNTQAYALALNHKHVPEMHHYSNTATAPIFAPSVANYYQGMLVNLPLFSHELNGAEPQDVLAILQQRYADEPFINVSDGLNAGPYLSPTACNGTNQIELMVSGNHQQLMLMARYDNLGKGAAGAAVQNLNLMLGLAEDTNL